MKTMTPTPSFISNMGWRLFLVVVFGVPLVLSASAGMVLAQTNPGLGPTLRIGHGLLMLIWGLIVLFRLGAFGPGRNAANRVKESSFGCALVLLGVGQLLLNPYLSGAITLVAAALVTAAFTGRPARLFSLSAVRHRDA
jgi:hypothetical protein